MAGLETSGDVSGRIFNIQRFSTHDGPGIRTTVFLKGCPLHCFWCQNPESQVLEPTLMVNSELCAGCGSCIKVCPSGANNRAEDGTVYYNRHKCELCGACVIECPNNARVIAGESISVDGVINEVLKDRQLYINSGGGITLSGGDPVLQPEFAVSLLKVSQQKWLHTAIETSGYTQWSVLSRLLEYADYVLFDLKCMNAERHKAGTGVENRLILENAEKVSRLKPVLFRTPLIPGFNDSVEDILAIKEFVTNTLGLSVTCLELLRYNNMGESKFGRLGREDEQPSLEPQTEEYFENMKSLVLE